MSSDYYCFFFNDTATTEIYTLSLHDALPICLVSTQRGRAGGTFVLDDPERPLHAGEITETMMAALRENYEFRLGVRSEEHTSELQSRQYLVCRLLLEKKKKISVADLQFTVTP